MTLVLGFHQIHGIMLADILRCGANKARAAHGRVADYVVHLRLHQLHHHFNDVARRAELAVGAALRNLAEQIFVNIAHDVLVVEVEAVQCVHDPHQHASRRHKEQRILHVACKSRVFSGVQIIFNKGKYAVNHVFEHGVRFKMTELAPAAILMLAVKNGIDNLHVKSRGVGFLAQFIVIEDFDKHQIRNLFNHRKGIGHAGRPEYIPNAVNFVFQFASNHIYSLLCVIDLKK